MRRSQKKFLIEKQDSIRISINAIHKRKNSLFIWALDEQIVLMRKHNFTCKRGFGKDKDRSKIFGP